MSQTRITLEESEIPTHWYNVVADMPNPCLLYTSDAADE